MRYYFIAGEASGDLHAANLVRALKALDPGADFRGWGGDRMEGEGVTLVKHYRDLAYMGFVEVLANLGDILRNLRLCREDLARYRPDALVLVDYPGFNLRIAAYARRMGWKVFYYISPQVWAWKKSRVRKIRQYVDRMFVILPFEKDFYAAHGYEVTYVGHPLLDVTEARLSGRAETREAFIRRHGLEGKPVVALLPGSRRQEIKNMLPVMLEASGRFPGYRFVIGAAPSVPETVYTGLTAAHPDVRLVAGEAYDLLAAADAAVVTSGTATLETALFEVPEVVCYRGHPFSYHIARKLIRVPYISLVNLVLNQPVLKELIQRDLTAGNVARELKRLLEDTGYREHMIRRFKRMKEQLGSGGASAKTASEIYRRLEAGHGEKP